MITVIVMWFDTIWLVHEIRAKCVYLYIEIHTKLSKLLYIYFSFSIKLTALSWNSMWLKQNFPFFYNYIYRRLFTCFFLSEIWCQNEKKCTKSLEDVSRLYFLFYDIKTILHRSVFITFIYFIHKPMPEMIFEKKYLLSSNYNSG